MERTYPTPQEYQEALQAPGAAFADPQLRRGEPEAGLLGLPQVVTGAYAAVFPVYTQDRRWAVKCFLSGVPDRQERYAAIAAALERAELDAAVDFEYQPEGLRMEGRRLPLVKMPWVEGAPLNRFVAEHHGEPVVIGTLAERWAALVRELAAAGVAHGDLQHGNVMVAGEAAAPALRLVDYDAFYVPSLDGRRSIEVGHRNYQHPDRGETDFGPYIDYFPSLVIYVALRAVEAEPALWERFDTGENLLFRADDFFDPASSVLFAELIEVDAVAPLVESLRRACLLEPEAVPPLDDVLDGRVLPDVVRRRARHEEGRPHARSLYEHVLFVGLAAGLLAAAVLSWLAGLVGVAVFVATMLGFSGGAAWRYRRLPPVRRGRRLRQEEAYFDGLLDRLEREARALERQRDEVVAGAEERREHRLEQLREETLYDRLKYHFVHEVAQIDGVSHKVMVRLKAGGVRTAFGATAETLEEIREIGPRSRQRVLEWRRGLVRRYEDDLPERLSPAQERRLDQVLAHRLREIDAERARLREKRRVQEAEREQVRRRLEKLADVSFGRYVAFLIHLARRPYR